MSKTNQKQKRQKENTNYPYKEWERDSYYTFLLKFK